MTDMIDHDEIARTIAEMTERRRSAFHTLAHSYESSAAHNLRMAERQERGPRGGLSQRERTYRRRAARAEKRAADCRAALAEMERR